MSGTGSTQAAFLRALADHLDQAGLAEVNVISDHGGGWDLQLFDQDSSAGLVGFTESVDVTELYVRALERQVTVSFRTTIGRWPVRVWGCVDPLREEMGLSIGTDSVISRVDLAYFAEHGSLPGGGA